MAPCLDERVILCLRHVYAAGCHNPRALRSLQAPQRCSSIGVPHDGTLRQWRRRRQQQRPALAWAPSCAVAHTKSSRRSQHSLHGGAPKEAAPRTVAVLGAGLTGLTAAYYVRKYLPHARVTVYESSPRLGGWVDTERIEVETAQGGAGYVLFERGARMALTGRPGAFNHLVLYELVWCSPVAEIGRALLSASANMLDQRPETP